MLSKSVKTIVLLSGVLLCVDTVAAQEKAMVIDALLTASHDTGVFNGAALVSENGIVIFKKGLGGSRTSSGRSLTPPTRSFAWARSPNSLQQRL